jgi:hypothetical protein
MRAFNYGEYIVEANAQRVVATKDTFLGDAPTTAASIVLTVQPGEDPLDAVARMANLLGCQCASTDALNKGESK